MVLVRTLLNAPALTLPPTRQLLLSHWRSSSVRSSCLVRSKFSVFSTGNDLNCLFDGRCESQKESRLQISRVIKNWGLARGLKRIPRRTGGWEDVAQTRVQCSSTFASDKELSIRFPVTLDENTTIDVNTQAVVDQLQIDGPLALKLVVEKFEDLANTEIVELSLLLCNDVFIQDLNSKWLGKDSPTDVLSFPQDQAPGLTTHLLLGDVIISVDTAARQAEERGHTLLDELRILLVHGLLHILGFDHELGADASLEMEEKETQILSKLGWKGKGLINAALESSPEDGAASTKSAGVSLDEPTRKPAPKPAFKILFCDMDGTLLNGKSIVTQATADALKAAKAKGVQVIIATGKTQYGAMAALQPVGLSGDSGVISANLPGVFTQGLQVYGRGGSVLHSASLDPDIVREAFDYSLEHNLPTLGFSANRIVTTFHHPLVDVMHDVYLEPKAFLYSLENGLPTLGFNENRTVTLFRSHLTDVLHTEYLEPEAEVIPSINDLMASCPVQKILFYSTPASIEYEIRPHWASKIQGRATLVQALDDMLEMLPLGQSKGAGVKILLDHFGISPQEVMAIGDGENDIEMLALAGWGVAMANGSAQTKAVANAQTGSNDEDGAAQAIHRYILS